MNRRLLEGMLYTLGIGIANLTVAHRTRLLLELELAGENQSSDGVTAAQSDFEKFVSNDNEAYGPKALSGMLLQYWRLRSNPSTVNYKWYAHFITDEYQIFDNLDNTGRDPDGIIERYTWGMDVGPHVNSSGWESARNRMKSHLHRLTHNVNVSIMPMLAGAGDLIDSYYNLARYITREDPPKFTAAFQTGDNHGYFFADGSFAKVGLPAGEIEGDKYPAPVKDHWPGLPAKFYGPDAVFSLGANVAFFVKGAECHPFDLARWKIAQTQTTRLSSQINGWPPSFDQIDAAFADLNEVYAFQGDQVMLFEINQAKVASGFPTKISKAFHDWPEDVARIDAALGVENRTVGPVKHPIVLFILTMKDKDGKPLPIQRGMTYMGIDSGVGIVWIPFSEPLPLASIWPELHRWMALADTPKTN